MLRPVLSALVVGACASGLPAREPKPAAEADAVFVIYYLDMGWTGTPPRTVFAAWQDGRVAWSNDRLRGGPPYRTGKINPDRVTNLVARLEKDGLFDDQKLRRVNAGGDHPRHLTIRVRSGKAVMRMSSWHELVEEDGKYVDIAVRIESLEGRRRLDVLREAPSDYRHFRFVWAETRVRVAELIPAESEPAKGKPVWEVGPVLYWREPAPPKSKGPGGLPGK